MEPFDIVEFVLAVFALSFLAGALEATKGLSLRHKVMGWTIWAVFAVIPTMFFARNLPDGATTVAIYSSSDPENSLLGPISAVGFVVVAVGLFWLGRQLGMAARARIVGRD